MAAKQSEQVKRIEKMLDATKAICVLLDPLTDRAKRRLLAYFQDLVTDPDEKGSLQEFEIVKSVRQFLSVLH